MTLSRAASWPEHQPTARGRNCQGETGAGRGRGRGGGGAGEGAGQPRRGILALSRPPPPELRPVCRPCLTQAMQLSLINRPFLRTPEQRALGAPLRESSTTRSKPAGLLVTLGASSATFLSSIENSTPLSRVSRKGQEIRKLYPWRPLPDFIKTLSTGSGALIYKGPPSSSKLLKRPTVQTSSKR